MPPPASSPWRRRPSPDPPRTSTMGAPIIHSSGRPDVVVPDIAVTPYVFARAAQYPDRLAFVDGATGRCLTYGALVATVPRVASGFAARGIGAGDVVGLMAPNLPEY